MSCGVCKEGSAKYRCPRCQVRSCCVACVKRHKDETQCNGQRDKTAFVPISKFSDNNLLSDYHFLEDVSRKTNSAERQSRQHDRRDRSRFVQKLVTQARRRHVDLRVLPYSFERRKANRTTYWKNTEKIMWLIEWTFPKADVKYTNHRVAEDTPLEEVLTGYLHPADSDPVIRHHLRDYVTAGMDNCSLCMKVEGRPADQLRYHKLDMKDTLANNLKGKRIVEFPSIVVVLPDQLSQYQLLSQDAGSVTQI